MGQTKKGGSMTDNKSLIPNSQIEEMFLRIANDEQMQKYNKLVNNIGISLATAYASNTVTHAFYKLVEYCEITGESVEKITAKKVKGVK